jgi:hypothetical protein
VAVPAAMAPRAAVNGDLSGLAVWSANRKFTSEGPGHSGPIPSGFGEGLKDPSRVPLAPPTIEKLDAFALSAADSQTIAAAARATTRLAAVLEISLRN